MRLIGTYAVPTIADQCASRGWDFARIRFAGECATSEYFNPAVVHWQSKDWLVVRHRTGPAGTPGQNRLELFELCSGLHRAGHVLQMPGAPPDESQEDPRCFVRGTTLIVAFCTFVPGNGFAHQSMTGVQAMSLAVEHPVSIKIGGNGATRNENTSHEKNWCPFLHEGVIHISYSLADRCHTVIQTQGGKAKQVWYGRAQTWPFGTLRGGTCAVKVDDLYWTFFHSSNDWYCGKRRYYMAALAFEPQPPFSVKRMARNPLLIGSELDFRNQWAPLCIWSAGAIIKDNVWHVSLGINDNCCGLVKIPHKDVLNNCYVTC